jgi:hypothetical protein
MIEVLHLKAESAGSFEELEEDVSAIVEEFYSHGDQSTGAAGTDPPAPRGLKAKLDQRVAIAAVP